MEQRPKSLWEAYMQGKERGKIYRDKMMFSAEHKASKMRNDAFGIKVSHVFTVAILFLALNLYGCMKTATAEHSVLAVFEDPDSHEKVNVEIPMQRGLVEQVTDIATKTGGKILSILDPFGVVRKVDSALGKVTSRVTDTLIGEKEARKKRSAESEETPKEAAAGIVLGANVALSELAQNASETICDDNSSQICGAISSALASFAEGGEARSKEIMQVTGKDGAMTPKAIERASDVYDKIHEKLAPHLRRRRSVETQVPTPITETANEYKWADTQYYPIVGSPNAGVQIIDDSDDLNAWDGTQNHPILSTGIRNKRALPLIIPAALAAAKAAAPALAITAGGVAAGAAIADRQNEKLVEQVVSQTTSNASAPMLPRANGYPVTSIAPQQQQVISVPAAQMVPPTAQQQIITIPPAQVTPQIPQTMMAQKPSDPDTGSIFGR